MHKIVNGEQVELSKEEEAQLIKEWDESLIQSKRDSLTSEIDVLKQQLADTDYKVVRAFEDGIAVSSEVKALRQDIRNQIYKLIQQQKDLQ